MLQPRDLNRGYEFGDDSGCGYASATEGDWPQLEPLFASEHPRACSIELQWAWRATAPKQRGITSAAYVFADAAGARRAYEARDELARFTSSLDVKAREPVGLADEGELLRGRGLNAPASGVVWRFGRVVALVSVEQANAKVARMLARKQQALLEKPGQPVPTQPKNDPELRLDDPGLTMPVYWFGRSFDPPGPPPPLHLMESSVGGNGPGESVQLWYSGVTLDTWQLDTWRRFQHTRLGRLIWDSPCAHKTVVPVRGGHAEIFQGYGAPNPLARPCPNDPPDRVIAHVYYHGFVVAVDMPYCYDCARSGSSSYETVVAMTTLVLSLHPRNRRS